MSISLISERLIFMRFPFDIVGLGLPRLSAAALVFPDELSFGFFGFPGRWFSQVFLFFGRAPLGFPKLSSAFPCFHFKFTS